MDADRSRVFLLSLKPRERARVVAWRAWIRSVWYGSGTERPEQRIQPVEMSGLEIFDLRLLNQMTAQQEAAAREAAEKARGTFPPGYPPPDDEPPREYA